MADVVTKVSGTWLWRRSPLALAVALLVFTAVLLVRAETATGRSLEPSAAGDESTLVIREAQLTPGPDLGPDQQGVGWVLIVVSSTDPVGVEHIGSVAGFNNLFGLASPVDMDLFYCKDVPQGFTISLGNFPVGTELIFRLRTPDGYTFYNGPASRNPDGVTHASVDELGPERWHLGWEDIFGGGDRDYNDCEMIVTGAVTGMSQPPTPTPTPSPTLTPTPTPTSTSTPTPTPTFTPTPTPTFTPTPTPVPELEAMKAASLLVDADGNSAASPGDTLRYDVTIVNTGGIAATGVVYRDTVDSNTTLVPGSVVTSQGTVVSGNTAGDTTVEVSIGAIPGGGGTVTISFQVTINNPLPGGVTRIVNQGIVSSNEVPDVPTDDPGTVTDDDPTVMPIVAAPMLEAEKTDTLLVDLDRNGVASPDDTLHYDVTIVNSGNIAATGVVYRDTVDSNTTLVPGSVLTSQGIVVSGNTAGDTVVEVNIGTIAGGGGLVTISFEVTINDPLPSGVTEIINQGIVSSNELPDVPTDDPETLAGDDPTVTRVVGGAIVPGVCWQLAGRIPQAVVDHALANPHLYFGWGQCVNPNAPCPSPANPYRHWLSLLNINAPYHPLFNPPIWQPSCPK